MPPRRSRLTGSGRWSVLIATLVVSATCGDRRPELQRAPAGAERLFAESPSALAVGYAGDFEAAAASRITRSIMASPRLTHSRNAA